MSSPTVVAIVFAVFAVMLLAGAICARVRSRSAGLPRSLVVEYAPRRGSTVIGDALLVEEDRRAASAALIDLAVRRKVRLIAESAAGGGTPAKPGRATVAVEVVDDSRFTARELALLEVLFGPGHPGHRVRRFSKDRRAVGRRLRALVEWNLVELTKAGLVSGTRPGRESIRLTGWLLVLVNAGLLLTRLGAGDDVGSIAGAIGLAATIATLIVVPRGRARAFTAEADPWRRHLDGLRQYLTVAEADRIRALQSPRTAELLDLSPEAHAELGTPGGRFRLHERLLPYAVLFGIEREWMSQLKLDHDALGDDERHALDLLDALDVASDLFLLADAIESLADLGFAVGDLVDAGGGALDVVGGLFEAIGDLAP